MILVFILSLAFSGFMSEARAWENHSEITRLALGGWDKWEDAPEEPLEKVLPSLDMGGVRFSSRASFEKALEINGAKAAWDDHPPAPVGADSPALTIIAWSADVPALGMDQDLNLSPDQEYLGGTQGPSSDLYRHMYLLPFDWKQPLITFHYPDPKRAVGQSHERADLFFDLAVQAKRAKHWYWAYRFLGLSLHYLEDLNEPYLCHQFGSVAVLPWSMMFQGKSRFWKVSFQAISNYRIAYEKYADFLLRRSIPGVGGRNSGVRDLDDVFRVPRATMLLKDALESHPDMDVKAAAQLMARASAMLAPLAVGAQMGMMAKDFNEGPVDLSTGFLDAAGKPKVDFEKYETSKVKDVMRHRDLFFDAVAEAYSNTGVAARWLFDKFRSI